MDETEVACGLLGAREGAGLAVTPHSSAPAGQEENDREQLPAVIERGKREGGRDGERGRERERERALSERAGQLTNPGLLCRLSNFRGEK